MSQRYFRTRTAAHPRYFRGGIQFGPQATAVPADHPRIELLLADPHLVEVSAEAAAVSREAKPEHANTSGTADGVPPNANSDRRGEGAGDDTVSGTPSRTADAPAKKTAAKPAKAKG